MSVRYGLLVTIAAAIGVLAACERESPADTNAVTDKPAANTKAAAARPRVDPQLIARGAQVFKQNCAQCHGERAQGAAHWEKPGADGKYPAPPLDGSAHAWHHPRAALVQTIKQGTVKIGGGMPGWQGKLSDADIDATIAYFQSLWPDEIYAAWRDIDARGGH